MYRVAQKRGATSVGSVQSPLSSACSVAWAPPQSPSDGANGGWAYPVNLRLRAVPLCLLARVWCRTRVGYFWATRAVTARPVHPSLKHSTAPCSVSLIGSLSNHLTRPDRLCIVLLNDCPASITTALFFGTVTLFSHSAAATMVYTSPSVNISAKCFNSSCFKGGRAFG